MSDEKINAFRGLGKSCIDEIYATRLKIQKLFPEVISAEIINILQNGDNHSSSLIETAAPTYVSVSIPEDIKELPFHNLLLFTRYMPVREYDSLKRMIKRVGRLGDVNGSNINDILKIKGVGRLTAEAFINWISNVHIGPYEPLINSLRVDTDDPTIYCSDYLKISLNRIGITNLYDLKKLDDLDSPISVIGHMEIRTLHFNQENGHLETLANIHFNEDLVTGLARYIDEEVDDRAKEFVISRYMSDEKRCVPLAEIGLEFNITRERVRQIIQKTITGFRKRYVITERYYWRKAIASIKASGNPLVFSDFSNSSTSSTKDMAPFFLNILADVFPELPITERLGRPQSPHLRSSGAILTLIMKTRALCNFEDFCVHANISGLHDKLLILQLIMASSKYVLVPAREDLIISRKKFSFQLSIFQCIAEMDRPLSIEEIVFYLDANSKNTKNVSSEYYETVKARGIGYTRIFRELNSHDKLVRIDRYVWGLKNHLSYNETHFDILGKEALKLIEDRNAQVSSAFLFTQMKAKFPKLKSRYELNYILQQSEYVKYLGYHTYVSATNADNDRITLKDLIVEILNKHSHPISVPALTAEIKKVRTFREEGVFTLLEQQENINIYFNQYISNGENKEKDLQFIIYQEDFIEKQIQKMYPQTTYQHLLNKIADVVQDKEEYLKFILSIPHVAYFESEDDIYFVGDSLSPAQKAVVVLLAEDRELFFDEILFHLKDSFNLSISGRDKFKYRLDVNNHIQKNSNGTYRYTDMEIIKNNHTNMLDDMELILLEVGCTLSAKNMIHELREIDFIFEHDEHDLITIAKSDDRFTVLGDDLICLL